MVRRVLVTSLVAAVGIALIPGGATAHTFKTGSLHISKAPAGAVDPGQKVLVLGEVRPGKCQDAGHEVTLYSKQPGPDPALGTDNTDGQGEFKFVLHPTEDHRVYARWDGFTEGGYGHSHKCVADKSNKVPINVIGA